LEEPKKKAGNPAWQKGVSANPNGRPAGSKNIATQQVRLAYQKLTEDNLQNMTLWLQDIAANDPKEAFELMLKMSEYVLPKLARTEVTGANGDDLFKDVSFSFGTPVNDRIIDLAPDAEETDYEDL
tara:strand:- start:128 stop:505 length:378 start_codon:yes stop_codon:yes gene_type:complete